MAENNSTFEEAYDVLDRLSADEKKRLEYEARQKAIRDHDIMMKTAKRLGLEAGIAEGREKGIARRKRIPEVIAVRPRSAALGNTCC